LRLQVSGEHITSPFPFQGIMLCHTICTIWRISMLGPQPIVPKKHRPARLLLLLT
jgi:hypothetical protein